MYDKGCLDLAESFMQDHPDTDSEATRSELAQRIQQTIDDYFAEKEDE